MKEQFEGIAPALKQTLYLVPSGQSKPIGSGGTHKSDCAVHNAPAYEPGECDCGAEEKLE